MQCHSKQIVLMCLLLLLKFCLDRELKLIITVCVENCSIYVNTGVRGILGKKKYEEEEKKKKRKRKTEKANNFGT